MPNVAIRQVLYCHAVAFAVSFVSLTALLVANSAGNLLSRLSEKGASGTLLEALLFSVPHAAALTIPMSVFVAVLWVFTRLGAEGTLAAARREQGGVRRLVRPVLVAAAGVAALTLVLNAQVVPRANERLVEVLVGSRPGRSDREMTVGQLRTAARSAQAETGPEARTRAARYEVEFPKKFALAAAVLVLALAGMAVALRFPGGGAALVIGASVTIFGAYWICLTTGESLADQLVVPPFVAMWLANAVLLGAALFVWRSGGFGTARGNEALALGG